jgi:benzoate membrane transport protein
LRIHTYEKGPGFASSLRDLPGTLTGSAFGTALISTIFGTSVDFLFIEVASKANWPNDYLAGFLFAAHFFAGFLGWILTFYYKQPIVGATSIPGYIFWAMGALHFSIPELYGAAVFAGLVVLLLGVTGTIDFLMDRLPFPVVMGMTAGCLMSMVTAIPGAILEAPIIAGAAFVGYIVCHRWTKWMPDTIGALILGCVALAIVGMPDFSGVEWTLSGPMFAMPAFNLQACLSLGLPLAILVVGAENAQAIGGMQGLGYKVPISAMTNYSGIMGMLGAFVCAHNINIAGPMTLICASPSALPDPDKRYGAAFLNGLFYGMIGLVVVPMITFLQAIPAALVTIIAGFAMVECIADCLKDAFRDGKFWMGGFFALFIALANNTIWHIDAPFWALVVGWLVSFICENEDYAEHLKAVKEKRAREEAEELASA